MDCLCVVITDTGTAGQYSGRIWTRWCRTQTQPEVFLWWEGGHCLDPWFWPPDKPGKYNNCDVSFTFGYCSLWDIFHVKWKTNCVKLLLILQVILVSFKDLFAFHWSRLFLFSFWDDRREKTYPSNPQDTFNASKSKVEDAKAYNSVHHSP